MPKKPRLNLAARTFQVELGAFLLICEELNTPRSLSCYMLAKAGEWMQYLDLSVPIQRSSSFADDYLVTEMLRKNPNLPIKLDRRLNATSAWKEAEKQCADTNVRLSAFTVGDVSPLQRSTRDVICKAQLIINDILGPLTRQKLDYMEQNFRFGPGSTSSVTGCDVLESKKYVCEMHITPSLYPFWRTLKTASHDVSLRAYSKVTFVPKTSKIDRAIAVEPHMNVFVQLGIGALLRRQLTQYGLNLNKQADVNRQLAGKAQSLGLATVDLASASDTIASELVWLLLPPDWATLLDLARTEYAVLDGEEIRLSKFSSMGNGFTFELESLIFLALARASGDCNAVTFGDDIILNADRVPVLRSALSFLGFSVNEKKTFLAGRFFESCGFDYFDGVMIRPFYLKGKYHDFSSACVRISNKIRRYSHMRNCNYGCDIRLLSAWKYATRACNLAAATYISDRFGDNGLIKNLDECTPAIARFGHEGYIASILRTRMRQFNVASCVGALNAAYHRGTLHSIKSLSSSRQYKDTVRGQQIVPFWYDLGAWC